MSTESTGLAAAAPGECSVVPADSRYVPLTQQRWCCTPTCVQMVMLRHGIPLVAAELLGYHMGLVVPAEQTRYFWRAHTGAMPISGWGTQVGSAGYELNRIFDALTIPLRGRLDLISAIPSAAALGAYLAEIESADRDALLCYAPGSLLGTAHRGGHVCVFDRLERSTGAVRMVDPDVESPKWQTVPLAALYRAMAEHGDVRGGGVWPIDRADSNDASAPA
jgi:hypothetical protein